MPTLNKIQNFLKKALQKLTLPNIAKAAAAVAFVVLLLTMLPAAIPDSEVEETRPAPSFDSKLPDMEVVATPKVFPHLVVVYPEREAWGKEEAEHVVSMLAAGFHAHFVVLSDSEYLALDEGTLALYNAEPSLTVTLGITELLKESYLEILSRLGADGVEIVREGERIDIISASCEKVTDACGRFISSVTVSGSYSVAEELFFSDPHPSAETDFTPDLVTDGEVKILTFAYIDNYDYTLRALEGIVAHVNPDVVIFNGGIDGGCSTRHELALLWGNVADILAKTDTPWCFTPGVLTGVIPRIVVCEVVSSFDGCLKQFKGDGAVTYSLTVANTAGEVTASIYVGDTYDTAENLCELIEADVKLYARASEREPAVIGIFPAIPAQLSSLEDVCADYTTDSLIDLYDSFKKAGGENLVCAADPAHPLTVDHEDGTLALCGSIGFSSRGLGGRFDYNNSIRGGMLLTLTPHRAGYTTVKPTYVFAADLGLTER